MTGSCQMISFKLLVTTLEVGINSAGVQAVRFQTSNGYILSNFKNIDNLSYYLFRFDNNQPFIGLWGN